MNITDESFNLSVRACCTLNFYVSLVSILCVLLFKGNICLLFGFFAALIAKFKHNFSLRSLKLSISSFCKAFL